MLATVALLVTGCAVRNDVEITIEGAGTAHVDWVVAFRGDIPPEVAEDLGLEPGEEPFADLPPVEQILADMGLDVRLTAGSSLEEYEDADGYRGYRLRRTAVPVAELAAIGRESGFGVAFPALEVTGSGEELSVVGTMPSREQVRAAYDQLARRLGAHVEPGGPADPPIRESRASLVLELPGRIVFHDADGAGHSRLRWAAGDEPRPVTARTAPPAEPVLPPGLPILAGGAVVLAVAAALAVGRRASVS